MAPNTIIIVVVFNFGTYPKKLSFCSTLTLFVIEESGAPSSGKKTRPFRYGKRKAIKQYAQVTAHLVNIERQENVCTHSCLFKLLWTKPGSLRNVKILTKCLLLPTEKHVKEHRTVYIQIYLALAQKWNDCLMHQGLRENLNKEFLRTNSNETSTVIDSELRYESNSRIYARWINWCSTIEVLCYRHIHERQIRDLPQWCSPCHLLWLNVRRLPKTKSHIAKMLRWISGITRYDYIRNEESGRIVGKLQEAHSILWSYNSCWQEFIRLALTFTW